MTDLITAKVQHKENAIEITKGTCQRDEEYSA